MKKLKVIPDAISFAKRDTGTPVLTFLFLARPPRNPYFFFFLNKLFIVLFGSQKERKN